ncbi:endolytic transglycosylase MltG [Patescibacteria group bacterium]|nr:endolytic transglycosylase MltG [Patescibacteria group bacterium]
MGNPSVESVHAVLEFVKNNNLYYLHDAQGQIYFAENIQGHNSNKSTHL